MASLTPQHNLRTPVQDVEDAVKYEMRNSAYGNTPELVETLFDDEDVPPFSVDMVFNALVEKGMYVEEMEETPGCWAGLPTAPTTEHGLYAPLTGILNAITAECAIQLAACRLELDTIDTRQNKSGRSTRSQSRINRQGQATLAAKEAFCRDSSKFQLDLVWRDEHATAPKSATQFMSDMKPDIVATFRNAVEGPVWWRSVHIPLEVKQPAASLSAAVQLLRYVRQALREQPDRRFTYGLVFAKQTLTVWHIDRTGALGSRVIDVHEDPMVFIRIIIGLVTKNPSELGWDPTMLMYAEDGDGNALDPIASYLVDANTNPQYARDAYQTKWVVTMDKPPAPIFASSGSVEDVASSNSMDEDALVPELGQERFVLYKALSLACGEVIRGRATRTWRAWHWDDLGLPEEDRRIFVFKDSWRDERHGIEGDLYMKVNGGQGAPGVAQIHSHGVVRVHKKEDDTLFLIRRGLKHEGKPLNLETSQTALRKNTAQSLTTVLADSKRVATEDSSVFPVTQSGTFYSWNQDFFEFAAQDDIPSPFNRIHSRLIMTSTGWPLVKFIDLSELLWGIHDAMSGHKWLFEHGILHRDISIGNILLTGRPSPDSAILIDLDNAIEWKVHKHHPGDVRSVGTLAFMSYEVLSGEPYILNAPIVRAANPFLAPSITEPEEPSGAPAVWVSHTAIHDLESFFWIICYIALYREGPGSSRTTWPEAAEASTELRKAMRLTFEQPVPSAIAGQKHLLFMRPGPFKNIIAAGFAPYFSPVITLVGWVYEELREAYSKREFDNVYAMFLGILSTAAEHPDTINLQQSTAAYRKMKKNAELWRQG